MTDSGFADNAAEIADQLREDPILVEQMLGNGFTAEIREALHQKLDAAGLPVFVVMTRTPLDLDPQSADEELASLLHAELGQDGIYLVQTSLGNGHVGVWGDLDPAVDNDSVLLSLALSKAQTEARGEVQDQWGPDTELADVADASLVLDLAAHDHIPPYDGRVLSRDEAAAYRAEIWMTTDYTYDDSPPELPTPGLSAVVATAVGLVVGVIGYRLLRAAGARRSKPAKPVGRPAPTPPPLEVAREQARAALAELQASLETVRSATVSAGQLDLAIGSRDQALRLVESRDLLDVVGAGVLARTGQHALTSSARVWRCCYANPLHGKGRHQAALPGGLQVPVCRPCQRDLKAGREPDALLEPRRGADRPYYVGGTVWARTGYGTLTEHLWRDVQEAENR